MNRTTSTDASTKATLEQNLMILFRDIPGEHLNLLVSRLSEEQRYTVEALLREQQGIGSNPRIQNTIKNIIQANFDPLGR